MVVNQVTAQMSGQTTHAFEGDAAAGTAPEPGQLTAALGVMWAHAVNTRLVLETIADVRYIKVHKFCPLLACVVSGFEGSAVLSTAPESGRLRASLGVMWAHAVNT